MFIWASVWSDVILYFHAFNYCRPLRNSKLLNQPLPSQKQRQLPLNRKKNLRKKRYVEMFFIKLLIADSCFLGGWWSLCNSITILKFSPWQYHLKEKKKLLFPCLHLHRAKFPWLFLYEKNFFSYWCLFIAGDENMNFLHFHLYWTSVNCRSMIAMWRKKMLNLLCSKLTSPNLRYGTN